MARRAKPTSEKSVELATAGQIKRELGKLYRLAKSRKIDTLDALRLARILGIMLHAIEIAEIQPVVERAREEMEAEAAARKAPRNGHDARWSS